MIGSLFMMVLVTLCPPGFSGVTRLNVKMLVLDVNENIKVMNNKGRRMSLTYFNVRRLVHSSQRPCSACLTE